MAAPKKIRIGDLLVTNGIITENQLQVALAEQKKTNQKLGKTLIKLKFLSEEKFLDFLSQQLDIPYINIAKEAIDYAQAKKIPEKLARDYRIVFLKETDMGWHIGMSDPTDLLVYDELSKLTAKEIRPSVVSEADVLVALDQIYRRTDEINSFAGQLGEEILENDFNFTDLINTDVENAPVVKLLQSLFEDAVQMNTSDIHLEPDEHVLRIRQRIDGVLNEHILNEVKIAPALVVRLKLLCGLNISERRLPQDGRFRIRIKGRPLDVRLSTLPMQYGESVVLRLLDQSDKGFDFKRLGMPEHVLSDFKKKIHYPHGIVLVTGPTGSGKTTTLYTALNEINQATTKIITAEDPIEYSISRINQVQINESIGLTFSAVLRSALRQDPDAILIGEIRDQETANIAIRASITGHLVFSTLHTNSAIETIARLIDMGVDGYLLASSLQCIVSQRLIRVICEHCKVDYKPNEAELEWLSAAGLDASQMSLKKGAGCQYCNLTGFKGRIGVYELLSIDASLKDALRSGSHLDFNRIAEKINFKTFQDDALMKMQEGLTALSEVIKISTQ